GTIGVHCPGAIKQAQGRYGVAFPLGGIAAGKSARTGIDLILAVPCAKFKAQPTDRPLRDVQLDLTEYRVVFVFHIGSGVALVGAIDEQIKDLELTARGAVRLLLRVQPADDPVKPVTKGGA